MDDTSVHAYPPDPRGKPWLKITCLGCVILPLLMTLLTFAYVKYRVNRKGEEMTVEVAKLRKMGIGTEASDFVANPPIPDNENAAILYRQAIAEKGKLLALKEPPEISQALSGSLSYEAFLDDPALIQQGLKHREALLRIVEEAAKRPKCDFRRDLSQGYKLRLPEYAFMKEMVKYLAMRAKYQAKAGDFAGALRSIRTCFAISGHLAQEPIFIAALVSFATQSMAMAGLEQVTISGKDNPAYLAEARKLLESLPPLPDLKRCFAGELTAGRYSIRMLRKLNELSVCDDCTQDSDSRTSTLDDVTLGDPAIRKFIEAKWVELWRWVFERYPSQPNDWKGVQKLMSDVDDKLAHDDSLDNRVNQILFPSFSDSAKLLGVAMAQRRVALVAVRLLQERPTGLPKDLSGFGSLAVDPLNGKPIRFARVGKGFKVWSIGRDLVDHGGVKYVPMTNMRFDQTDYVWGFDVPFPALPVAKELRIDPHKKKSGGPPRYPPANIDAD